MAHRKCLGHTQSEDPAYVGVGRNPNAEAIDAQTGRVFVGNRGNSSVSALDAAEGQVVRTTAVSADPLALAVDVRARMFVAIQADTEGITGHLEYLEMEGEEAKVVLARM